MNYSEQTPVPDEIDIALQAHLDRLNAAFADFKRAEIETLDAERQKDGDTLIRLWYAKNQAAQAYMQEWDILIRYGTLFFDEQANTFHFASNNNNSQLSEAE
jgi:hypothetical protein